ncbi:MAG: hypothetical protein TUN42_03920 [Dehalogenimonas sp.]
MATKAAIEKFFADYARRFNESLTGNLDVETTASAFAPCFIEASTRGVICANNYDQFRSMIPRGTEFYRSIGTTSMKVKSVEVTPLDPQHDMVRVFWHSEYLKQNGETVFIDFDVIYLLEDISVAPRNFGYITGDEQQVLKDHGLVP